MIQNAIKFSREDGNITIDVFAHGDLPTVNKSLVTYQIKVSDEGQGIAKEDQPNLFSKYFKSKNKMGKETHGLGLSICKQIATSFGGDLYLATEYENGAQFVLEI